jgi:hypothetical protein
VLAGLTKAGDFGTTVLTKNIKLSATSESALTNDARDLDGEADSMDAPNVDGPSRYDSAFDFEGSFQDLRDSFDERGNRGDIAGDVPDELYFGL